MAGHKYVTNGNSNYTDVPPQEGGYVVETTTVGRFRVPPMGHDEIYELNYGKDNENASPPRYYERENLMDNFLNKFQIAASRPAKTGNLSGPNKYLPTKPNKYRSKSPTYSYPSREPPFIKSQNLPAPNNRYQPVSPDNYQSVSPQKYRPTSPSKYHTTSPNKYRPTSPGNYRQTSPTKYRPTSPTKYRPTSPDKYRPISPTKYHEIGSGKYQPTNPTKFQQTNPTKFQQTNPAKYQPISPTKYRPTSPTKYRPTSPIKFQQTNPTKFQQTKPAKYQPTSPTRNYPSKDNHMVTPQNLPGPIKNQLTNPVHNVPRESQSIRTQSMSDPNTFYPSNQRSENYPIFTADEIPDPNNHWQSTNPPVPHKLLSNPTNDINEALSFLAESVNNSPRAQPVKPEKRFGWKALGATAGRYMKSDAIDSKEAIKKYNGAHVP